MLEILRIGDPTGLTGILPIRAQMLYNYPGYLAAELLLDFASFVAVEI